MLKQLDLRLGSQLLLIDLLNGYLEKIRNSPMFNKVTVDLIVHSDDKSEFALYLVEDAPWGDVELRVKKMQDRVYTTVDAVLDGIVASDYPDSKGKRIRIEVVCRGESPSPRFREVVNRLNQIIHSVDDYVSDINRSGYVSSLEITYSQR